MTDILGSESILSPSIGVDTSAIDKNLRAISQVESSWRLPTIPDDVKLDLASQPGMDHQSLSNFLYGTESDLFSDPGEDPIDTAAPKPAFSVVGSVGQYGPLAVTGFQEATSLISTLRGMKPSEALDADAVQRWKLKAIDAGYMDAPADGVIDGSWTPELYGMQRQMQYAEYDNRMRGDRPGAMPFSKALQLLGEWTSPSGLMRAAVGLDLFWDFGQIGKEWESWGDKWRKVADSKNPLDFAGNLFDAMTGPIDDIVVPALNLTLLFSGIGAATNFGRLALTGTKALEAAETVSFASRLYEVPKIGSFLGRIAPAFDAAAAGRLGEASWTAQKLMGASSETLNTIGKGMAAWRELPTVIDTRGMVQTGMRLGIVAQAEDRLLPNYHGKGADDIPAVADMATRALSNPWITTVGEVLFTPYTIFDPGTFLNGGRSAVQGVFRYLGTTPGRATAGALIGAGVASIGDADTGDVLTGAAIGAGAGAAAPFLGGALEKAATFGGYKVPILSSAVKGAGKALSLTNWEPLGKDQRITQVFLDAIRAKAAPEEWATWQQNISKQGFLSAFADHIGTDTTNAQAAMGYVMVSAAIDRTAALQAGVHRSAGWHQRYWLARNKLVAQLRVFGEDVTREEAAWTIISKEVGGSRGRRGRYDDLLRQFDEQPERLAEAIALHNEQAALTMRQLLSPDNLPVNAFTETSQRNLSGLLAKGDGHYEALTKYVGDALDSFGRWGVYQPLSHDLGSHVGAGLFDEMRLAPAVSYLGKPVKLNVLEAMPEYSPPIDESMWSDWSTHLNDTIFGDRAVDIATARKHGLYVNPLAAEIEPTRQRLTLARADTPTKQEYLAAANELEQVVDSMESYLKASRVMTPLAPVPPGVDRTALIDQIDLGSITSRQLTETLKAAGLADSKQAKAFEKVRQMVAHMKSQGIDVDRNFQFAIKDFADSLGSDARWARFRQDSRLLGKDDKVLSGLDLLKARAKALKGDARYVAAHIDTEDLLAKLAATHGPDSAQVRDLKAFLDHADSQGYKAVYGVDFLMPDELLNRTGIFADVNERHMNAMTIGNFFGRRHPQELAMNVQIARTRSIARSLSRARGTDLAVDDRDVLMAVDDLYRHVLDPELTTNRALLSDVHHQSLLEKAGTAFRTSKQPMSMQDLGLGVSRKKVVATLEQLGWSKQEAGAIWQGLKEARYAEWKDLGLYAIEAKLRTRNQFVDALHVLGGTPNASVWRKAAGGAAIGAVAGAVAGNDNQDILTGAVAGAVARPLAGVGTAKLEKAMDFTNWARYGYLADNMAAFRDRMRFSLSPFFDASRYTEAWMLGQVAAPKRLEDGTRIALPLNQSPTRLRKAFVKEGGEAYAAGKMKQIEQEFFAASRGHYNLTELESTAKWFESIGMLGFNPTRWMMSTFHYLRESGLDAEKAYHAVQEMYTYGTKARSAFEQSVNFVFFPFSFQKKTIGHMAGWVADDLSRSVLIHDAYKAYQLLDENYDLGAWVEEHVPVLKKLQQLNLFAYGISPGRLGGINAPYAEALFGDPTSPDPANKGLIFNLFNPQGVSLTDAAQDELKTIMRKTIPAINDLNQMMEQLKQQGHVVFDPTHQTRFAQARDAYDQWFEYRRGVEAALKNAGATWYDLYNNPGLADLYAQYQAKKLELQRKYPGWDEAKKAGMERKYELDLERQQRINTVQYEPAEATVTDVQFYQMESMMDELMQRAKPYGITDIEQLPPEEFDRIRGVGIEMARSNPNFLLVWNRFYARDWGIITSVVE